MAFDNFVSPLVPEQENGCANALVSRSKIRCLFGPQMNILYFLSDRPSFFIRMYIFFGNDHLQLKD
jgi:hypothetical protein